jgi:hypothetical protein
MFLRAWKTWTRGLSSITSIRSKDGLMSDVNAAGKYRLTRVNAHPKIGRMNRPRHPNKHIEKAIQHAESLGRRVEMSDGHAFCMIFCPLETPDGHIVSIWSTPRVPENHARHIRRKVDSCEHGTTSEQEEE